jgi:proteasome lid subunit RPN8/RPN11
MQLLLPPKIIKRLQRELRRAGKQEIGGLLMGEHVRDEIFRVVDISVQRAGGSEAYFIRDPASHKTQLEKFFADTGADYSRFNYLGEWHSHPTFEAVPSYRHPDNAVAGERPGGWCQLPGVVGSKGFKRKENRSHSYGIQADSVSDGCSDFDGSPQSKRDETRILRMGAECFQVLSGNGHPPSHRKHRKSTTLSSRLRGIFPSFLNFWKPGLLISTMES